ncbi:common central domain of tyrosinase-domain-containing protein [Jackrogersella minutella]|nr:common central domain of tyrosinase-domain-containing protein [Jackrogersella minutella]
MPVTANNDADNNGTYGISGIPHPPKIKFKTKKIPYAPDMPVRLRLSTLASSDDPLIRMQWTLFILALERFKALPVENKLSYFQIAGIHGYPETSWDGAPPPKDPTAPGEDFFYCAHNSITFPTWHRPYMLLYEKQLWHHMKEIIKSWVKITQFEAEKWNEAADTWRLPYWDWAQRQTYNDEFSLPEVFTKDTVKLYGPLAYDTEYKKPYPNPLWGFENPEKGSDRKPLAMGKMPENKEQWKIKDDDSDPKQPLPWSRCSGVSRYGIKGKNSNYTGLEGVNNFKDANISIENFFKNVQNPFPHKPSPFLDKNTNHCWRTPPGSLADAVSRMFSKDYNTTWATFASTKWWKESDKTMSTGYMSLEYIHNNVHNLSGGSSLETGLGHMSDVPVAAFDPLFWLHHCNVDRLLSMWQILNWDEWWTSPYIINTTNTADDPKPEDPLKPFHTKDNDPKEEYWTSEMARDWTKLNYQYDDLVPEKHAINPDGTLNEERYKTDILHHIQKIYPSTQNYIHEIHHDDRIKNEDFFGQDNIENGSWDDYILNVVYDRYALNGRSYTIQFWFGDHSTGHQIGQVYAFAGLVPRTAEAGGCANCGSQRDNKVLSRAQVPLTTAIAVKALDNSYEHIQSMVQKEVKEFLIKNLHWRFVQLGGDVKSASKFPDTEISIWRGTGEPQDHRDGKSRIPAAFSSYQRLSDLVADGKGWGQTPDDSKLGDDAQKGFIHFRR